ncbi:hypothetical protein N7489_001675 [Penicillium chrysogenum]|uniref:Uncharacterized protein n=1 Tax=Penicillium chrysogenum TaxID=5076 RepID=A0ABQ8WJP2_PENCH|nr:uncharacterized protein N7489_001675 [Penicillium chrysogenum]KAJ5251265.1 hypothetical protein N7489_001675 [Penicillium chrysogenum]KAJ5270160.1 hypothetical protein N7505_005918 [Penicillium chrysogenum]KAJ6147098.1 hypothetical protein N7497_009080 [Penicillium chrysogenum]
MHFSKIIPVTLFAALAVAAPAPAPQMSFNLEQVKQLSQNVQSWASSTASGFDNLNDQLEALDFSGQAAQQSLAEALGQLQEAVAKVTDVASEIASALDGATESYQETEQSNADRFG